MWMMWLGAGLLLGVVEMLTVDFIFLMFAGGAFAAFLAALLGAPLIVQILVFGVVSVLLLLLARPAAREWMARTSPATLTNAQALIGREAIAVHDVTDAGGRVKLAGEVWSARSAHPGDVFIEGTKLVVVAIDGAIAVVALPGQPTY